MIGAAKVGTGAVGEQGESWCAWFLLSESQWKTLLVHRLSP